MILCGSLGHYFIHCWRLVFITIHKSSLLMWNQIRKIQSESPYYVILDILMLLASTPSSKMSGLCLQMLGLVLRVLNIGVTRIHARQILVHVDIIEFGFGRGATTSDFRI